MIHQLFVNGYEAEPWSRFIWEVFAMQIIGLAVVWRSRRGAS